jgi:hypothetical protein
VLIGTINCVQHFPWARSTSLKKKYLKLFLFLLNVAITNAWIYYKLSNPKVSEGKRSRADFYQQLAEILANPNMAWKDK